MSAVVTVIDTLGNLVATLDPLEGSSVAFDRAQNKRRSADLTFEDPTGALVPTTATSLLAPSHLSGHYLKVVADGTCMGTYAINGTATADTGSDRSVHVTAYDRSWLIGRSTLKAAYGVSAGTAWAAAIQALLNSVLPGLSFAAWPNPGFLAPAVVLSPGGNSPWAEAQGNWAVSIGAELYWSRGLASQVLDDAPQLLTVTDPRSAARVWSFTDAAGAAGGTLTEVASSMLGDTSGATLSASVSATTGGVPNYFIRDGQLGPAVAASALPVTAAAFDSNPASPSFVGGPSGEIVDYAQNTLITSAAQAQAVASAALYLSLGAAAPISLRVVPNATSRALDVGQVGTVTRSKAGLSGAVVVIDSVHHQLGVTSATQLSGRRVA